jgi:hypothetical protein
MSALGADAVPDTCDLMAGKRSHATEGEGMAREFVVNWRKAAGLPYYERLTNSRYVVKVNGQRIDHMDYATEAGARGRIAMEARRAKNGKAA